MKIKFVTVNIWYGGTLFDNLVSFLKKENPDIIAMQEVYDGTNPLWERSFRSLIELKKSLPGYHVAFSPSLIDTRPFGDILWGNAIFSKFPIIDQKTTFYAIPFGKFDISAKKNMQMVPRNLQIAKIDFGNVGLYVCNTHGIWDTHGGDSQERLAMSKTIVSEIGDRKPAILAGDFNLIPQTETIRNIEKHLKSVFEDTLPTTFNMERKDKQYGKSAVDMVFVSNGIKVLEKQCPQVDISDHLPLVCVFDV